MTGATGLTDEPASSRRPGWHAADLSARYEGPLTGLTARTHDAVTLSHASSQRFLEVSDSFCALTGYSREELLGRTAPEVGLTGEDPRRVAAIASVERGLGVVNEPEIRRKDGTLREPCATACGEQGLCVTAPYRGRGRSLRRGWWSLSW
jgi:PAS domain-containing protein